MEVVDTVIRFLNCYMLDSDYNNTVDFNNKSEQIQWFNQHTKWINEEFDYQRKNNNLKVGYSLDELKLINYLIIDNSNGERFFYFIMDKEYVSDNVTNLILKLDLIQTYLFDIDFKECLVERQHIQELNNSTDVTQRVKLSVDEGLDTGEYRLEKTIDIYNYISNGSYIFTSSERLGISDDERINFLDSSEGGDEGTGGTPNTNENYKNGYLDEMGFWAMKSFEGFKSEPYQDTNGYWTVGYGITQAYQLDYYNQFLENPTEENGAKIMGQVVYNFSSQVKELCDSYLGESWLNQNRLNALTSYAYQWGLGGLESSGLFGLISSGANDTEVYNYYKNITEYSERRQQEAEIFLGNYPNEYLITNWSTLTYITDNGGKGYIPKEYQ